MIGRDYIPVKNIINDLDELFLGSVTPDDIPGGLGGVNFWLATESGTYTNFGGVIVSSASFALISRDANGNFSISETPIELIDDLLYKSVAPFSKNLINPATLSNNSFINFSTGAVTAYGTPNVWKVTDYIPVYENLPYFLNKINVSGSAGYAFYDENQVFLSGGKYQLMQAPANAKFLRVTIPFTETQPQIELGFEASTYTAYNSENYSLPKLSFNLQKETLQKNRLVKIGSGKPSKVIGIIGTSISAMTTVDSIVNSNNRYKNELMTSAGSGVEFFLRNNASISLSASQFTLKNASLIGTTDTYSYQPAYSTTLNAEIEFYLSGNELHICQCINNTANYGIMELYRDDVLITTFNNKNYDSANKIRFIKKGTFQQGYKMTNPDSFTSFYFEDTLTEEKIHKYKIKLVGGVTPYMYIDFVTNKLHHTINGAKSGSTFNTFFNAPTPGSIGQAIEGIYENYIPDTVVIELGANNTSITGTYGNSLVVSGIDYLSCNYVSGTMPAIGDIIMFGSWKGDYKDIAQRRITNIVGSVIYWGNPLIANSINNIDSLAELPTTAYTKNFDALNVEMLRTVNRLREVNSNVKMIFVSHRLPSWSNTLAGIWGLELYYQKFAKDNNVEVLNNEEYIRSYLYAKCTGNTYLDIVANNSDSYDVSSFITGLNKQGFKVIVNGVDVYNKDCYVDILAKTLVFRKNKPASGTIKLIGADIDWSYDGTHPTEQGNIIYIESLIQKLNEKK